MVFICDQFYIRLGQLMQISCSKIEQVLGKTMLSFFSHLFLLVDGFGWPFDSNTLVFLLLYLLLLRIEQSFDSIPILFLLIGIFWFVTIVRCTPFKLVISLFSIFFYQWLIFGGYSILQLLFSSVATQFYSHFFLGGHLIQTCLFIFF